MTCIGQNTFFFFFTQSVILLVPECGCIHTLVIQIFIMINISNPYMFGTFKLQHTVSYRNQIKMSRSFRNVLLAFNVFIPTLFLNILSFFQHNFDMEAHSHKVGI